METNDLDLEKLFKDPGLRAVAEASAWTEEQAKRVVDAQVRSGLSVQAFCARLGIKSWRLYKWRGRLRSEGAEAGTPEGGDAAALPGPFVTVRLPAPPPVASPRQVLAVVQHPSGLRVRFYRPVPETLWQQLREMLVPSC